MSGELAKVFLEYGESKHYHGKCIKMYTGFTNPNGDWCELYAEVKIPKKPVKEHYYLGVKCVDARPFFKKNGELDSVKFFRFAESELEAELMRQAGEWKSRIDWNSVYGITCDEWMEFMSKSELFADGESEERKQYEIFRQWRNDRKEKE